MISKHNNLFVYNTYDEFGLDSYNYVKGNDIIAYVDAIFEVIYWLYFELIWKPLGVQSTNSGYHVDGVSLRKVTLNYSEGSNKYTTLPAIPDEERLGDLTNFLTNYPYIKNVKLNNTIHIYNINYAFQNCKFDIFELNTEYVEHVNSAFYNSTFKKLVLNFDRSIFEFNNMFNENSYVEDLTLNTKSNYTFNICSAKNITYNHSVNIYHTTNNVENINADNIIFDDYACIDESSLTLNCNILKFIFTTYYYGELTNKPIIINAKNIIFIGDVYEINKYNVIYFNSCLKFNYNIIETISINDDIYFNIKKLNNSVLNIIYNENLKTNLNLEDVKNKIQITRTYPDDNKLSVVVGLFIYNKTIDTNFINTYNFLPICFTDESCTKYQNINIESNKIINIFCDKDIDELKVKSNSGILRITFNTNAYIENNNEDSPIQIYFPNINTIDNTNIQKLAGNINIYVDAYYDEVLKILNKFNPTKNNFININNDRYINDEIYDKLIENNVKLFDISNCTFYAQEQHKIYVVDKIYKYRENTVLNTFWKQYESTIPVCIVLELNENQYNFCNTMDNSYVFYYVSKGDKNIKVYNNPDSLSISSFCLFEDNYGFNEDQKEFIKEYFVINRYEKVAITAPNDDLNITELFIDSVTIDTGDVTTNTTVTNIVCNEFVNEYPLQSNIRGFKSLTSECLNDLCSKLKDITYLYLDRSQYNKLTKETINYVLSKSAQFVIRED